MAETKNTMSEDEAIKVLRDLLMPAQHRYKEKKMAIEMAIECLEANKKKKV